jgi:Fe-S-cluster containining protein
MNGAPEASGPPVAEVDPDRVRAPLRALYAELDAEVAALGPVCVASGRCCRFREYDHMLFLTAAEARLLIADAPPPARPLDDGASCPWQDEAGRCSARDARPLGCRVYFCDPNYEGRAEPLTERYLARVGALAESLGLPRGYASLHHHLHAAVAAGVLRDESPAGARPVGDSRRDDPVEVREALDISPSDQ